MVYTLEDFRADLQYLDRTVGSPTAKMFECRVEVRDGWFCFDFDGFLPCRIRVDEAGVVSEVVDEHPATYPSVQAWKDKVVAELSVDIT